MTRERRLLAAATMLGVLLGASALRADDMADLLSVMPGDQAVVVVLANPAELDKAIQAVAKRLDGGGDDGFLEDLKGELRLGKDVDFTKPMGVILGGEPPAWAAPVFVVAFPDAEAQIKTIDGASEEGGVWTLPDAGIVVKIAGKYVMVSDSGDALRGLAESKTRLAEAIKPHAAAIQSRHVMVRLDVARMRPMLKMALEQGRQMLPMIAAMSGQGDATGSVNVFNGVLAATGAFVDQVDSFVAAANVTRDNLNVAVSAGFMDGGIKSYLNAQKPPRRPFFTTLNAQPFFYAFAADLPGDQSPFFSFLADAMKAPSGAPDGGAEAAPEGDTDVVADATAKALAFYRMIEGNDALAAFGDEGMTACGYYTTSDPHKFVETMKEAMLAGDQLMNFASGGMSFKIGEPKSFGDVQTVELEVTLDPSNPQSAMAAQMMGGASHMSIGVRDGRVGVVAGPDAYREAFFTGKVESPLASDPFVKAGIEALGGRPNAVVVFDPAGVMPLINMFAPMIGGPANLPKLGPGPVISAGLTLSGHPARLDFNLPWAAIERIIKAMEADAPM